MTRCLGCGIAKKTTAFSKQKNRDGSYRRKSQCKACEVDKQAARMQKLTIEQKLQRKSNFYLRTYGITIEQYNEIFVAQNGKCLGCIKHQSEFEKALVVDHNHTTKIVRGLLCSGCNLALGNTRENPNTLENLANCIRNA